MAVTSAYAETVTVTVTILSEQPAETNLIENGSFEGTTSHTSWRVYDGTTDGLEWDVSWRDGSCGNRTPTLELQRGILGGANTGEQHAELDSYCPTIISQNILTESGETYEVSFASKNRPRTADNSNGLQVAAGNSVLGIISPMSDSWQTATYSFTANSTSTSISFTDTGNRDGLGTFLDSITVTKSNSNINLIQNGSFEDVLVSKKWVRLKETAPNVSWSISWNENNPHTAPGMMCPTSPLLEIQNGILGGAKSGVQHAELDSHCHVQRKTSTMISQSIATEPAESYDVSFASKKRPGTADDSNALQVSIDGTTLGTLSALSNNWETTTYTFTATSDSTTISFADIGKPDGRGTFLDDVIVTKAGDDSNLISNGSFESVTMNRSWQTFDTDAISSWNVSWNESNPYILGNDNYFTCPGDGRVEVQRGILGGANSGNNHAELDSHCYTKFHTPVMISQDVTTASGMQYELSWHSKARPNTAQNTNGLAVSVNGIVIETTSPMDDEWTQYSYTFTAASDSTTISFADVGIPNTYGTFLDGISVSSVR